jgi:[ribosomal protein S5]-alanine N-acetyltransferase
MQNKILETERLYLREFTIDDAQLLIDLNTLEVLRYVGEPPPKDVADAKRILTEIILPQYKNKIGRWAVHLKSNDEFIGWCGLKYLVDTGEIDLGYRFFKIHWGKGYATESAKAVLDYGVNTMKLKNIKAQAAKGNTASLNVIKKLGFTYVKDDLCSHDLSEVYILK